MHYMYAHGRERQREGERNYYKLNNPTIELVLLLHYWWIILRFSISQTANISITKARILMLQDGGSALNNDSSNLFSCELYARPLKIY